MEADYRNTLPSVHRVVSNSLVVAVRPSACLQGYTRGPLDE